MNVRFTCAACLFSLLAMGLSVSFGQESKEDANQDSDELGKPFVIYDENPHGRVVPSGWMPDGKGIGFDSKWKTDPYSGQVSARVQCDLSAQPEGYVGIAHLVDGLWKKPKNPLDLFKQLGAKAGDTIVLRWHARSSTGAVVRFEFGGGEASSAVFARSTEPITLKDKWQAYELNLTDLDISACSGKLFTYVIESAQQDGEREKHEFQFDRVYLTKVARKPLKSE